VTKLLISLASLTIILMAARSCLSDVENQRRSELETACKEAISYDHLVSLGMPSTADNLLDKCVSEKTAEQ
jgi:hypothetical protein